MKDAAQNTWINAQVSRRMTIAAFAVSYTTISFGQTDNDAVSLEFARKELGAGKVTLIDVREPEEHATCVAQGVQLLPMRQLGARIGEIPRDPKRPVLLICNSQNRSSATLRLLRGKGCSNVRYVLGMSEWNRRRWPLVRP